MDDNLMEKYAMVYKWLEDDISKDIYINRMFYNVTGKKQYIKDIVSKNIAKKPALMLRDDFDGFLGKKVIIYGIGSWGKKLYDLFNIIGVEVWAFCDKKALDIPDGWLWEDTRIISPYEASKEKDALIIIASDKYMKEMIEQLKEYDVNENNVLIMDKSWFIYNSPDQYFEEEIICLKDHEVFVDCGAADGYDTLRFLDKSGENSVSICFEPFAENIQALNEKFYYNHSVSIVEKGVWNRTCSVSLNSGNTRYSAKLTEDGKGDIDVVSLDSELFHKLDKITYIKMDIEKSELKALDGSKNIILRDKPRLAICIYHNPEDIYEIPIFIKNLVPEYKLHIRHYSNYGCETVLYATL